MPLTLIIGLLLKLAALVIVLRQVRSCSLKCSGALLVMTEIAL